jgi:hypothetical protein
MQGLSRIRRDGFFYLDSTEVPPPVVLLFNRFNLPVVDGQKTT